MRIAAIVGGFPKLSETFILRQITGLMDLGHEVDIYSRTRPDEATVQPDVLRYGLLQRTQYFQLPATRAERLGRAMGTLLAHLPRHPWAMLKCLDALRYRSVYALLNNIMFVAPFLSRRYHAVLCYWGGNGMDFIILKDVFPQMRFVTRFGGDDYAIGDEQGPEALALLRDRADAFIVQTDYYGRATLRRYGFDDRKIVTFRHVIAVEKIPFRERRPEGDRVRILSVARLVPKKGFDFAIRAAVALQAANPDRRVEYRIVGDGPLRKDLEKLIDDLKARDTVQLLGALTTPEVMRCMETSHIYLLPSLMEQAGYVLLEAQATGLPLVVTRVGGVPEMVREGKSALMIPAGDVRSMVEALQHLVDHPELWPSMGKEGRHHVAEKHDFDHLIPRLAEILRG